MSHRLYNSPIKARSCTQLATMESADMTFIRESPDERRLECVALNCIDNTAETTQPSPRENDYNHNTRAAQPFGYSVQSSQRQQPSIHHAHSPLSFRPRRLGQACRFPSAADQAHNINSAQSGAPDLPHDPIPEPALSINPISITKKTTSGEQQHIQGLSSLRNRSRSLNSNCTTQAGSSHGRPASSRHRSRSPALAAQSLSYRDRSRACRQGSSAFDRSDEGEPAPVPAAVHGLNIDGSIIAERQLRMVELQKEKNKHAVCVHCWLKELPCDQQSPCKECKTRGISCAYVACPMANCALDIKCPAYHQNKKFPEGPRKIGCPMHMLALLNLHRPFINSYDVEKIQKKIEAPTSAQQIYLHLQQEIEHLDQQKGRFDYLLAKKLLSESEKVPRMGEKSLKLKARFIDKLVKEMKSQPYRELWEHDRRQRKFDSQESGKLEAEDTPMLDLDG